MKELTNLLLNRLGFGSCFLVQDHVAATFGSGLGHACVVDAGAEKISVSCVEDGVSQASVCLEYGGSDVTQVFQWLLQKCSFPYKEWSPANARDCHLLNRLKEKHCHLNLVGREKFLFVFRNELMEFIFRTFAEPRSNSSK